MNALAYFLALISAGGLIAAFAPFNLWPLAWVALAPIFIVYSKSSFRTSLAATLLMGAVFFGGLLYWITIFGYAPWVLLALFQALFFVGFCAVAYPAFRARSAWFRLLVVPSVWTAFEWLRSLGLLGFTWGNLAQSQVNYLPVIQVVSVTGPWGLAFLIAAANVALAELLLSRRTALAQAGLVAAAICAAIIWGAFALCAGRASGKPVRVAIIQGNVDQEVRPRQTWDEHRTRTIAEYVTITSETLKRRPDLVIWPETAIPDQFSRPGGPRRLLGYLASAARVYLLVGASDIVPGPSGDAMREYNGAFLFSPHGDLVGKYYKAHLVPFGEVVFGRKWLPFLARYKIRDFDYAPGPGYLPLRADFGNLGVMICFESIFPQISRQLAKRGANVLVVMTNDAWFKRTAAAEQHHAMSVLRAVENRRFLARCAATGISSVIDPWGRVLDSAGIFRKKIIYRDIVPLTRQAPYTRLGDWFAYLCVVLSFAGLIWTRQSRMGDG
ncbi:MAG: apolipoprotein N-acyltransferase [Armatimonadota bacterium]|nr:apolipoprotein N-acyltransferase [Armatimonadota bacterium]